MPCYPIPYSTFHLLLIKFVQFIIDGAQFGVEVQSFCPKNKTKKNQMLKVEGDGIESMLPFKIYSTLPVNLMVTIVW